MARETGQVLGQRKLFQRRPARPDARLHLLGIPDPAHDDLEALGQAIDPRTSRSHGSATPGGSASSQDVFATACWSGSRSRSGSGSCSGRSGSSAPPAGCLPDPRADLLDRPRPCCSTTARVSRRGHRRPDGVDPVSTAVSHLFTWMSPGWRPFLAWIFLWAHLAFVLGFLVYLPYSKHLHIATSALNVCISARARAARWSRSAIDMAECGGRRAMARKPRSSRPDAKEAARPRRMHGVRPVPERLSGMEYGQALVAEAAHHGPAGPRPRGGTGRSWPAQAAGEAFEPQALVPGIEIDDEAVWACTTCGACVEECPVDIEHIDTIVDLRRALVMGESPLPRRGRRHAA